ncbi:MAG: DUF11 domain-containing protein, partial [Actinobacteria bacterium]|nr:DUF11 domain-containing protein [Actinomycetota bacterium]
MLGGLASPASAAITDAWTISTVAGTGTFGSSGDGGAATGAQLGFPIGVAADAAGNRYIADTFNHRVRKVDAAGIITTVAGTGDQGFAGDGGPATAARLNLPSDVAADAAGNLFIADYNNQRVRRVDASGVITTVAGDGIKGASGDGGPATAAQLSDPDFVALDRVGNLYISEFGSSRIRKVDAAGIITTVAGNGKTGFGGDGGPATSARLAYPGDVAVDAAGNIFIADPGNQRVRKVDTSGIITTVAGNGTQGFKGDGGNATQARLNTPIGLAVQGSGNLFIADLYNYRIRRVDTAGTIVSVAGIGVSGSTGDGGPAFAANLSGPDTLALGPDGLSLYVAEPTGNRVRRVETSYLWMSDAPHQVSVGQTITYTVTLSGLPTAASGVSITDALPAGASFVSAKASQGTCSQASGTVTCQLGSVAYKAAPVVTIAAIATKGGAVLTNTATMRANEYPRGFGAVAQTEVSAAGCGRAINKSITLAADLGPCAGDGIVVKGSGLALDLGGHRVYGFPGPGDGNAAGIRVVKRTGVSVKNGTVSDFDGGVVIEQGASNTVRDLTVRDNVGPDDVFDSELGDGIIVFNSASNRILRNTMVHNGIFDGIGVLGNASNDNVIEDNTVQDTAGPADGGGAGQGIIVDAYLDGPFNGAVISGNQVNRNTVRRSGSAGIANVNSTNSSISNNIVEANGFTNYRGNGIGVNIGDNPVSRVTNNTVQGNQVHGNAWSGIDVVSEGNLITGNDAANNVQAPVTYLRLFDLLDENANCDSNVWSANIWGSGGYSPACTTAAGYLAAQSSSLTA